MYFSYDHLEFRYEPFPIGIAKPLMDESVYSQLLDCYPPQELFAYLPKVGHKYSLSEKFNKRQYQDFVRTQPVWREFHRWIKSDAFVSGVMDTLRAHSIDLGYGKPISPTKRLIKTVKNTLRGNQKPRSLRLNTRFEFSMLPVDGGHVLPHTDLPSKIVTLIVSMVREADWDSAYGGGTDVNRLKDSRFSFNRLNRRALSKIWRCLAPTNLPPNQAVIFIKTFNSWHSVRPMTGAGSSAMRKTLTINIEAR